MLSIINKIRRLFTPADKWRLFRIVLLMSLSALGELLGIGLLIGVIAVFLKPDILFQNSWVHFYFSFWNGNQQAFIIFNIVLVGVGLVAKNIFALAVIQVQARYIFAKQREISARLFQSYLAADYRYSLEHSVAERNQRITRSMSLGTGVLLPLMQVLADGIVVLFLCGIMFYFIPWIALGGIAFMGGAGIVIYWMTRNLNGRLGGAFEHMWQKAGEVQHMALAGGKEIKISGTIAFFLQYFIEMQKKIADISVRLYTMGQLPRLLLESAALVLLLVIFISMLHLGYDSARILLTFSMIVATMARILPALSRCNYNITTIRQNQKLFNFIFDDMCCIEPEKLGNPHEAMSFSRGIEIQNLSFGYVGGRSIISNCSFSLRCNQSLGVYGKTGCGKTTFVDLLVGLLHPTQGRILVDGKDIFENLSAWRKLIGYVSQNTFIMEGSIRENIAFGLAPDEIDDEKIDFALEVAQLKDWVLELPDGVHSHIYADGSNLSGGQRQRIGIARALYVRPALLILDEATSALDVYTEKAFGDALETLQGNLTMVVIAHRLQTIQKCDFLLCLDSDSPQVQANIRNNTI